MPPRRSLRDPRSRLGPPSGATLNTHTGCEEGGREGGREASGYSEEESWVLGGRSRREREGGMEERLGWRRRERRRRRERGKRWEERGGREEEEKGASVLDDVMR